MSKFNSAVFGVIVSDDHRFTIWPTHHRLFPGWHFTGHTGTQAAMQALVEQQFVETVPDMQIGEDQRYRTTELAN
jgi:uncharacterized protein YbdZ (MbtH family)